MQTISIQAYGVVATVYECDIGEGLPVHRHDVPHGHAVVRGRTEVTIGSDPPFEMTREFGNKELPADIDHAIVAMENGTVFVNIIAASPDGGMAGTAATGRKGGVMLRDGTIVYAD